MNASAYLDLPPIPEPDLLPGDLKVDARGLYRCTAAVWLGFGRGADGWYYILEAV